MTTSRSKFVKCPFYRYEKNRTIGCSGISHGCSLTLTYRTEAEWNQQMHIFCEDHYDKCEVFRMLWDVYDI